VGGRGQCLGTERIEVRKMSVNCTDSHTLGARFVSTLLTY